MGGYIWFPKFRNPEESYDCWLIKGLRAIVLLFLVMMAFIFIDSNIKFLFFGIAGYANITQFIARVILTFLLSFEILVGANFVAPNRKGLITFATVLFTFLYLSIFYPIGSNPFIIEIFGSEYKTLYVILFVPILVGLLTLLSLTGIEFFLKKKSKQRKFDRPFWNKQKEAKKIFSLKFNLILYILITAELILTFQGLSLLFWITFIF